MNKTELNTLFTRETFIQAMRREKQRKKEWEEQMNNMLDRMQEQINQADKTKYFEFV